MFAKLRKKIVSPTGALLTQTAQPVLLAMLADIETRNAKVGITCGGTTYKGHILGGNAEVMIFQPDPYTRNGFNVVYPPVNLVLAHVSAVQEVKS